MAVPKQFATWHEDLIASQAAKTTIRTRINFLAALCRHAGISDPNQLTREHFTRFVADRDLKPSTVSNYLDHVNAWAKFAGVPSPLKGFRRPELPVYWPRPLDPPQYEALTAHVARDADLATWTHLGGDIALRSFETAKVAGTNLNRFTRKLYVVGKRRRTDWLELPDPLFNDLAARADVTQGPLWPGKAADKLSGDVAVAAAQIGIRMEYHMLRHTAITAFYRLTKDILRTQAFARHKSVKTTMVYALFCAESNRDVLNAMHGATDATEAADVAAEDHQLLAALRSAGLSAADLLRLIVQLKNGEGEGGPAADL